MTRATSAHTTGAQTLFEECTKLFERAHPYAVEEFAWHSTGEPAGFGIHVAAANEPWRIDVTLDASGRPCGYDFSSCMRPDAFRAYVTSQKCTTDKFEAPASTADIVKLMQVVQDASIYPMMQRIFAYMPADATEGLCWLEQEMIPYGTDTHLDPDMKVPSGVPYYCTLSTTGEPFLRPTKDEKPFIENFWELVAAGVLVDVTVELANAAEPFVFGLGHNNAAMSLMITSTKHIPCDTIFWNNPPTKTDRDIFMGMLKRTEPGSEKDYRTQLQRFIRCIPKQPPSFISSKAAF